MVRARSGRGDVNRSLSVAHMRTPDVEAIERQLRLPSFGPFDRDNGLPIEILFQPEIGNSLDRFKAIEIDMGQGKASLIFMDQDKRRTTHATRGGPQSCGQP